MERYLKLRAHAKINLGLDVTGRREDGYHLVKMVMQSVGLHDIVELTAEKKPGIRLETDLPGLAADQTNLAWRAAKLLMDEFGIREGLHIRIEKSIPVAGGMAGGSTDAAAVLYGVNRIFSLGLSTKELMERGLRLGADVPFCILRGTALAEGIGEVLTELPPMMHCSILIAKPAFSVSTGEIYTRLDHMTPAEDDVSAEAEAFRAMKPDTEGILEALKRGDLDRLISSMGNTLENVTVALHPEIRQLEDRMVLLGAERAMMSGSGPTVFGIFRDEEKAGEALRILRDDAEKLGLKQVYLTEPYQPGRGRDNRKGREEDAG